MNKWIVQIDRTPMDNTIELYEYKKKKKIMYARNIILIAKVYSIFFLFCRYKNDNVIFNDYFL